MVVFGGLHVEITALKTVGDFQVGGPRHWRDRHHILHPILAHQLNLLHRTHEFYKLTSRDNAI